jgi:hypothetical protein
MQGVLNTMLAAECTVLRQKTKQGSACCTAHSTKPDCDVVQPTPLSLIGMSLDQPTSTCSSSKQQARCATLGGHWQGSSGHTGKLCVTCAHLQPACPLPGWLLLLWPIVHPLGHDQSAFAAAGGTRQVDVPAVNRHEAMRRCCNGTSCDPNLQFSTHRSTLAIDVPVHSASGATFYRTAGRKHFQ